MQNCLDMAIDELPACDQVSELNELTELTILNKTLNAIISWTPFMTTSKLEFKRLVAWKQLPRYCKAFQSAMTCSGVGVVPCVTW
jgi:hypothetical protein